MWNTLITFTTVGYGDLYPKTYGGRIIGMIIIFWGVFLVSFFVVTLQNMLTFNSNEEKSYTLLQRLEYKMQLKEQAAKVLVKSYKQRII